MSNDNPGKTSTPVEPGPHFKGVTAQTEYESRGDLMYPKLGGVVSMSDDTNNTVPAVSPTGKPVLPQWLVLAATVLVAVAGALMAMPGLPPIVSAICGIVLAVGVALGLASPGLRKSP